MPAGVIDKPSHLTAGSLQHFLRITGATASSGKANDWRNREHVVLDFFSNFTWLKVFRFFGDPVGQVRTLRG